MPESDLIALGVRRIGTHEDRDALAVPPNDLPEFRVLRFRRLHPVGHERVVDETGIEFDYDLAFDQLLLDLIGAFDPLGDFPRLSEIAPTALGSRIVRSIPRSGRTFCMGVGCVSSEDGAVSASGASKEIFRAIISDPKRA